MMKTKAFIIFGAVVLVALVIVVGSKSPDKDGYGTEGKALLAGINANLEKNNIVTTDELNFTPLYEYQYMNDTLRGDEIIGYETGFSLMNKLGLTTQVPKRREIATNAYRKNIDDRFIIVRKPVITVNTGNFRYLQTLFNIGE